MLLTFVNDMIRIFHKRIVCILVKIIHSDVISFRVLLNFEKIPRFLLRSNFPGLISEFEKVAVCLFHASYNNSKICFYSFLSKFFQDLK